MQYFSDQNFYIYIFSSETYEADLAVIELAHRVDFDQFKQPVHLAMPGSDYTNMSMNGTGWGLKRERGESSQRFVFISFVYIDNSDSYLFIILFYLGYVDSWFLTSN